MVINARDQEALSNARELIAKMQTILPESIRDTSPADVVGALLTISLQHCDSILALALTGANQASYEALIRPATESVLRLHWVVESEQRAIQATSKIARFPRFSSLLKVPAKPTSKSSTTNPLTEMHDMAHAGMAQLIKHFADAEKPSEPESIAYLRILAFLCVMLASIACLSFCQFTQRDDEMTKIKEIFSSGPIRWLMSILVDLLKLFADKRVMSR